MFIFTLIKGNQPTNLNTYDKWFHFARLNHFRSRRPCFFYKRGNPRHSFKKYIFKNIFLLFKGYPKAETFC